MKAIVYLGANMADKSMTGTEPPHLPRNPETSSGKFNANYTSHDVGVELNSTTNLTTSPTSIRRCLWLPSYPTRDDSYLQNSSTIRQPHLHSPSYLIAKSIYSPQLRGATRGYNLAVNSLWPLLVALNPAKATLRASHLTANSNAKHQTATDATIAVGQLYVVVKGILVVVVVVGISNGNL